jgi:glutathione S-transferase
VADEGFMHCSFAHQVRGVAERFYADVDRLVVLHLDRVRLEPVLRIEPAAEGIDELFPHVYGTLPTDAVTDTTDWQRSSDGWGEPPVS